MKGNVMGPAGPKEASGGYLREAVLRREGVPSFEEYPFRIPAIARLDRLALHPKVTFFIGENGSGKSTLIEALAVAAGMNPEGGGRNFAFSTNRNHSRLHEHLRLIRGTKREKDSFFLRAESFFNVATEIERVDDGDPGFRAAYGGVFPHRRSHGESFLSLMVDRFAGNGLYLLDEPEAALSPARQLAFLSRLHELVQKKRSQFVVATHSPILMAYPEAALLEFSDRGIEAVGYEDTDHFKVTSRFMKDRGRVLRRLFETI